MTATLIVIKLVLSVTSVSIYNEQCNTVTLSANERSCNTLITLLFDFFKPCGTPAVNDFSLTATRKPPKTRNHFPRRSGVIVTERSAETALLPDRDFTHTRV